MARHQHAVVWTRVDGAPRKMGDLLRQPEQCSFTYLDDYLDSGLPGLCLLGDGRLWGRESLVYPISERVPVLPRLLSLIPGRNPRNLQRRHYLDLLRARLGREPPPGSETEWQLLLLGGHGGIGHLDVFADDLAAHAWYEEAARVAAATGTEAVPGGRAALWRLLRREVRDEPLELDPALIEQVLGPTPSVGGMIPKLLVSMTAADLAAGRAAFGPPGARGGVALVLKVEPPEYPGLLDLEALCLDLHREAGFAVPRHWRLATDGLEFLAIERFDRDAEGRPLPMESLFSVIATGDHGFRETGDLLLSELGGILQRLGEVAQLPADSGEALYRRFLFALLTGNGDLHLDNLALLGGLDDCRLSPVYDPAPMRAWPRHDLVSAIPFDPEGQVDHGGVFIDLGRQFGLRPGRLRQVVEEALAQTADYAERVTDLTDPARPGWTPS